MSKKRKEYIDQLLGDLKLLEERILSVKESDTLPFSFFSHSFDRIEKISRSLHELELMQIGEMKEQMERLVRFLSESDQRNNVEAVDPVDNISMNEQEQELSDNRDILPLVEPESIGQQPESAELQPPQAESVEQPSQQPEDVEQQLQQPESDEQDLQYPEKVNITASKIIFPEYRDPRISVETPSSTDPNHPISEKDEWGKSTHPSLNDVIQAPPAILDLKRGISINDRFLFQRELFHNNRSEMDSVVEKLSTLGSFDEAQDYLKRELDWDFKNQTVKDFLLVIKKGFE